MRIALALVLACGHAAPPSPSPPAPQRDVPPLQVEAIHPACLKYGYYVLYDAIPPSETRSAFVAANAAATRDYAIAEDAESKGDHHEAALRFLACAKRYRAVPEADVLWSSAAKNADLCYGNAMLAYANARAFEREGKPALEQAVSDDPRLADAIRARLAKPPTECGI